MRRNRLFYRATALLGVILTYALIFEQIAFAVSEEKFNMSYIYFGNSNSYVDRVNKTKDSLDEIAPSYFDLNTDGTLKLTGALDSGFIEEMHKKGIKVVPFLSNHWDRQVGTAALANKDLLSSQISDAISRYNLDGVNIDIENVTESERNSYTDFARLLKEKLPKGKSVSVAVAPNPNNVTTGWYGSYDYAGLAQYCDYIMLMAYDEHYKGGVEGAIAGAPFVERTIKAALEKVPSNKLVLGIAFHGRLWKQGAAYGGYGISASQVEELIGKYRGVVVYDKKIQSAKAIINIKTTDVKPYLLGKQLSAGKYDIWYENEQSIKYKLVLIKKYNLKGTGSWSLGQETGSTWDYYKQWLNGCYLTDVEGYWAQQSILNVINKGWMEGISSMSFSPDGILTRAQAAAILVKALGITENADGEANGMAFHDTAGHWAENEIEIARQNNIISGIGNGKFAPDMPVTREQMAVMFGRVFTQPDDMNDIESSFTDVSADTSPWAYDYILKMTQYGILHGYPDGKFYPKKVMSRGQMAALIDRASGYIANGLL